MLYNKAIDYLERNNDRVLAKKYLEKSIEVNPLYVPALYKLSAILTEEGDLKKAAELVNVILNKTYPDTAAYKQILILAYNIYDEFIKKTEELKQQEKYNDAEDELLAAEQFCNSNSVINCQESLEKEIGTTKYGIYKSFLTIAERAVNKKHYDIAENFIFSAIDYRKKNEQYIKENKEAENMADTIIDRYMNKANSYINSGKYQKAMECFGKASALCDSIKDDECNNRVKKGISSIKINVYKEYVTKAQDYMNKGQPDEAEDELNKAKSYRKSNIKDISDSSFSNIILKRIKYEEYKRLIQEGKGYLEDNNYEFAFRSLDNADKLEKKYGLDKNDEKDNLIKIAAKPVIKEKLKSCDIKIWADELEEADNMLKSCEDMQLKYFLKNDNELNYIISELKQKVVRRQCGNDQDAYDLLMYKANNCVEKQDYTGAVKIYNDAINIGNRTS